MPGLCHLPPVDTNRDGERNVLRRNDTMTRAPTNTSTLGLATAFTNTHHNQFFRFGAGIEVSDETSTVPTTGLFLGTDLGPIYTPSPWRLPNAKTNENKCATALCLPVDRVLELRVNGCVKQGRSAGSSIHSGHV